MLLRVLQRARVRGAQAVGAVVDTTRFRNGSHSVSCIHQQRQQPQQPQRHHRRGFAGQPQGSASPAFRADTNAIDTHALLRVWNLVRGFRAHGHLVADLDPLRLSQLKPQYVDTFGRFLERCSQDEDAAPAPSSSSPSSTVFDLSGFGLAGVDQNKPIDLGSAIHTKELWTLRELVSLFRTVYCGTVGVEYQQLSNKDDKKWMRKQIERAGAWTLPEAEQVSTFRQLLEVESFERTLAKEFPAAKRFGIEGCEAVVPALSAMIAEAARGGVQHVELGMAHRGRLAVLAHVMQKPLGAIFNEFGNKRDHLHVGDVKYHLGTHTTIRVPSAGGLFDDDLEVSCTLSANPSHLEIVDPIVMGRTRAKQTCEGDVKRRDNLGVLIHGDASFCGQGIVAETLQLAELGSYTTGGMIHFIINNQIGFTTTPHRNRSSTHPTDVAKLLGIPILHVNADDPCACVAVAKIAARWRQRTGRSVVVDVVGYRRHGHNELDNPFYTQPLMYTRIAKHPTVLQVYSDTLRKRRVLDDDAIQQATKDVDAMLAQKLQESERYTPTAQDWLPSSWQASAMLLAKDGIANSSNPDTGVAVELLEDVAHKVFAPKELASLTLHKDIAKLLQTRLAMVTKGKNIDWGCAEALAFATLVAEGAHVRVSGQDTERGTFNQRHAVQYDQCTEERFCGVEQLAEHSDGHFEIHNSTLSEAAALGYEYGYSLALRNALTVWEAQFGDFANGAQAIIDTVIASGEHRWQLQSGLVILLPHGSEGQGPDHSDARLERYLHLCHADADEIPGFTDKDLQDIDTGFDAVDTDGCGSLSFEEVMKALALFTGDGNLAEKSDVVGSDEESNLSSLQSSDTELGIDDAKQREAVARQLFTNLDTDGNGEIDRDEWRAFMSNWIRENAARSHNLLVLVPTTPAQYFHALRRQVRRSFEKPAAVLTPKYLLHHRPCASDIGEFATGTRFRTVLRHVPEPRDVEAESVRRVIMCSGQVYYTLARARRSKKAWDVAIVRVEQLAPFPFDSLADATIRRYPNAELVWVQEEPKNSGAWSYVQPRLTTMVTSTRSTDQELQSMMYRRRRASKAALGVRYVGRPAAAAATGSFHVHTKEVAEYIVEPAFAESLDDLLGDQDLHQIA